MKYATTVTGWGEEALSFLEDESDPFIVIFNNNAPEELAEISILHEPATLRADPEPGDTFTIGKKSFTITAVGDEARYTLRELGHCTLKFSGGESPDLPGCIMLKGEAITAADITVGAKIEIA